jgi:fumarate reductase (CoM/CoB) subunit B
MKRKEHHEKLRRASEECSRCGVCVDSCELLGGLGVRPGEIARTITDDEVHNDTIAAVQRCDLCGLCGQECKSGIEPAEIMLAARTVLHHQGKLPIQDYDVALVDRDWNIFSLYRATYAIDYTDLKREQYKTLFLPGCSLGSFAPELTRATCTWLLSQDIQSTQATDLGFSELCCGEPLHNMGLKQRADQYSHYLGEMLRKAGADTIITACPGSFGYLTKSLPEIKVLSLYRLMNEAGIRVTTEERLTVHDSCADRRSYGPKAGEDVRHMLEGNELVEMKHHGKRSLCCGSGGVVSLVDPELFLKRARRRLGEFEETGAHRMITACMTCVYSLSQVSKPYQVAHFLELVFGITVNQGQILENLYAMWDGEPGEANQARLLQACCFTSQEEG